MQETLISFPTAKLAKEKGFDIEVQNSWEYAGKAKTPFWEIDGFGEAATDIIKAPSQAILQKWLREVHNIDIVVIPSKSGYHATILFVDKITGNYNDIEIEGYFKTYEQSLEHGLFEALKLIPDENNR